MDGDLEADLVEKFVRASGPGGQKVNKTSSAVYLKHLPSGIEVKAQERGAEGSVGRGQARGQEQIALGGVEECANAPEGALVLVLVLGWRVEGSR